jgi:hypothetical protein
VEGLATDAAPGDALRAAMKALDDRKAALAPLVQQKRTSAMEDPVLLRLVRLYDGRVGAKPDEKWYQTAFEAGKARYARRTPPGWRDDVPKKDEPPRKRYGDYLLWQETIEYAKQEKHAVLFITNDVKEDWFRRASGHTLGPCPELLEEMRTVGGVAFWAYTLDAFLERAKTYLNTKTKDASVAAVRATVERDTLARASSRISAFAQQIALHNAARQLSTPVDREALERAFQALAAVALQASNRNPEDVRKTFDMLLSEVEIGSIVGPSPWHSTLRYRRRLPAGNPINWSSLEPKPVLPTPLKPQIDAAPPSDDSTLGGTKGTPDTTG